MLSDLCWVLQCEITSLPQCPVTFLFKASQHWLWEWILLWAWLTPTTPHVLMLYLFSLQFAPIWWLGSLCYHAYSTVPFSQFFFLHISCSMKPKIRKAKQQALALTLPQAPPNLKQLPLLGVAGEYWDFIVFLSSIWLENECLILTTEDTAPGVKGVWSQVLRCLLWAVSL